MQESVYALMTAGVFLYVYQLYVQIQTERLSHLPT